MRISYDPPKRELTLRERGLDFEDGRFVFAGLVLEQVDTRSDYGEERMITVGHLRGRMVVVVWTQRRELRVASCELRHIISMRKANAREIDRYGPAFGV
jgi:uncharacterized DUF497 family protein